MSLPILRRISLVRSCRRWWARWPKPASGASLEFRGARRDLFNALQDEGRLRLIVPRHETAGIHMACGHHLATGEVVCCATTAGPGLTNAYTGLATAREECIPLILGRAMCPSGITDALRFRRWGPMGSMSAPRSGPAANPWWRSCTPAWCAGQLKRPSPTPPRAGRARSS